MKCVQVDHIRDIWIPLHCDQEIISNENEFPGTVCLDTNLEVVSAVKCAIKRAVDQLLS